MAYKVRIIQGDIALSKCEAIVNAANNQLWMGSGVAGAIKRAGGDEIEKQAILKGPIEVGYAVETTAGKLNAKYVIHAAVMGADLVTSEKIVTKATLSTLMLAEKLGIRSIAFPAFGTGVGGLNIGKCAIAMKHGLSEWANASKWDIEIEFVLSTGELKSVFSFMFQSR